jgi:hypothetical protein
MGPLEPGDRVAHVSELKPNQLGASPYRLTEKEFPAFVEDVRCVLTDTDLAIDENAQSQMKRNPSRGARQHQADAVQPLVGRYYLPKFYRFGSEAKARS